ncbi:Ankyrin repeat-containing domain protein [Rhypophila sp. PSN 637]
MSLDSKSNQTPGAEPEQDMAQASSTSPNPFEQTPTTSGPSSSSGSPSSPGPTAVNSDDTPPSYTLTVPVPGSSHQPVESSAVPAYTTASPYEEPTASLTTLKNRALAASIPLPITKFEPTTTTYPSQADRLGHTHLPLAHQIINAFFRSIISQNDELVSLFISQGLISPDCPNARGETPLIVAVSTGHGGIVCTLVNHGADVNLAGRYEPDSILSLSKKQHGQGGDLYQFEVEFSAHQLAAENRDFAGRLPLRTPLMVAALMGNLALVKLLINDFKADDGIIAPDGQLALRLAADRSHREIVEFLPARRGGAWRRWKNHHEKAVRRIKKAGRNLYDFAKFFVWDLPRFFLWSCPKHMVFLPLKKAAVWVGKNYQHFPGWCSRQVKALPGRVKKGVEKLGRGVKALGRGIKKIPGFVGRVMKWLWRVVSSIPGFMKIVGVWVWQCLKKIGMAVGDVFLRVVSAIHTAVMAVLGFFRRITLKDVWNGFVSVVKAVFVDLPMAIWNGVKSFGEVSYKAMRKLFGWVGQLLWYLSLGLFWVVVFVPKQLWKVLTAIGSSIAKGYHEIMVWFNPKH